jgi:L-asparaginase
LNSFDSNGYGTAVLSKPVIITGSQVPMFYRAKDNAELTLNFNTDAYQNFCGAVACARTGIPEVCVYFLDVLYRGNRILKTNASEFNAFSSPNYPVLAEYGVVLTLYSEHWLPGPVHERVSLDHSEVRVVQQAALETLKASIHGFPVMQFNAFPAWYTMNPPGSFIADLINSMVNVGVKGIILESYGEGNFPSGNPDNPVAGAIFQALKNANAHGVNIADCTQVIAGTVNSSAYAAGSWLPQVGVLAPADMTPMAALVKLMVLMSSAESNGWSRDQVRSLMQTSLAGEMRSVNSLDSRTNDVLHLGQALSSLDGSAILTNDQSSGLILVGSDGTMLWSIPITFSESDLPGRLVMQNDGNLVFYNRCNQPCWATGTGHAAGASSKLTLTGSFDALNPANSTLILQVYSYSDMRVTSIIYK